MKVIVCSQFEEFEDADGWHCYAEGQEVEIINDNGVNLLCRGPCRFHGGMVKQVLMYNQVQHIEGDENAIV